MLLGGKLLLLLMLLFEAGTVRLKLSISNASEAEVCLGRPTCETGAVYVNMSDGKDASFNREEFYVLPNSFARVWESRQPELFHQKELPWRMPMQGQPGDILNVVRAGQAPVRFRVATLPWLLEHYRRDDADEVMDAALAKHLEAAIESDSFEKTIEA
eukprot:gnl/TRDRNA2_/TRDRNA2_174856_c0_seq7.p1 gnl/TRDRNA2_/TRDRNA2_174856_c0~~gnl/TRDRNA2_/TRDRNA2_174856_c0_seq7.p1  ORF type:complete len:158 (+),score=18.01 gnl/TRDRNA2_/TRDRNA2_174856_c0_seq7:85-558(+)